MNYSEAAKLSRLSRAEMQKRIDEMAVKYRPQVIRTYDDNGHQVKVVSPGYGCNIQQYCKGTSRTGPYTI